MKPLKLTNDEIGTLCLALAHLYHAGIGTGDALALLAEDEPASDLRQLLASMSCQADDGAPLWQIFRRADCVPAYVWGLLEVGERVGRTEDTLHALARYYEERARMERRLKATLLYPAVLLAVLLAVVVILLVWVLPVFNDVYARLGSRLTGVAGGLLALGSALRKAMPVLCALLALAVVCAAVPAASPRLRRALSARWRVVWGDKGLARQLNTARFAQALSMGLRSGLSAQEAVELASKLAEGSPAFRSRCTVCLDRLEHGERLPAALREAALLSPAECRLLDAGLRGGSGEGIMEQIAGRKLEESTAALEDRLSRIEPVLVVILSILVGVILLSVMLPLMHIMSAIG